MSISTCARVRNAMAVFTCHGLCFDVELTLPELCADKRAFKSDVDPT